MIGRLFAKWQIYSLLMKDKGKNYYFLEHLGVGICMQIFQIDDTIYYVKFLILVIFGV